MSDPKEPRQAFNPDPPLQEWKNTSPKGEENKPAQPVVDPSQLAVPERDESRQRVIREKVIVPESDEISEEQILHHIHSDGGDQKKDPFENWFILLLFLFSSLAVILSSSDVGMSWDEAYYVEAAQRTTHWLNGLVGPGSAPLDAASIERFWDGVNREPRGHPSVTRFLVALGGGLFGGDQSPLWGMRIPIALCYGLTIVLIYVWMRREFGRVTGWLSVLAYFFLPRVFGHAHFAVTETPMVLMNLMVVVCFIRGLRRPRWAIWCGVFFGIALATKINAILLPLILFPWAYVFHRRVMLHNVMAMLFVGPVVMILLWPWLWHETIPHFLQYLLWNFSHSQLGLFYLGDIYNSSTGPVPWHYPFRLLFFTTPLVVLILAAIGLARLAGSPAKHSHDTLIIWAVLLPCLLMALPTSPNYDGVRLMLNIYPFLAALAGIGGGVLVRIAAYYDKPAGFRRISLAGGVLTLIILALAGSGGWDMMRNGPYYLSYTNMILGGREGAKGDLELHYWGESLNQKAIERLNAVVPDHASLCPRAMNIEVLRYYQQWGWLKPEIKLVEDDVADYVLLQYRFGLHGAPDFLLVKEYEPILTLGPKEAPAFGLYETGPEFYGRLQNMK